MLNIFISIHPWVIIQEYLALQVMTFNVPFYKRLYPIKLIVLLIFIAQFLSLVRLSFVLLTPDFTLICFEENFSEVMSAGVSILIISVRLYRSIFIRWTSLLFTQKTLFSNSFSKFLSLGHTNLKIFSLFIASYQSG